MVVVLEVRPNEGYDATQALENGKTMTVGALRNWLEDYDDDTRIVTYDLSNYRGASYGVLVDVSDKDEREDEEDYE